jgi:signal transduction histidine kinase
MDLSWIRDKLGKEFTPVKVREKLDEMSYMLDEAIGTVRKVASDLRPHILDDFGLVEALDWQSKEFTKRSGIPVEFMHDTGELKFDPSKSIGLFRIYQEVLTNIARHAEAKNVVTSLDSIPGQFSLSITDDGKGFDSSRQNKTLGLLGMRERAHMIGGNINISSEPGKGTKVLITVSLLQNEKPIKAIIEKAGA